MHTQSDLEENGKREEYVFIETIKEVTDTHFILKWNSDFKKTLLKSMYYFQELQRHEVLQRL